MARERELPPQKRFSLSGRRLSSISVTKGPIARPLTCQDVPWNTLMEQITKANGTRGSNYVAKALPGWKYDGLRDPEDMSDDSEELPRPRSKPSAKEKATKRSPRRLAPSLEGCRWTTWSHVCRPFTPDTEIGTLKPKQFNLWEEKRIFSPNRSWPKQPSNPKLAASPEFYDHQRTGMPWKAVSWKHRGQIFSDLPPMKKRPRSAFLRARAKVTEMDIERPSSAQGKTRHPSIERRASMDAAAAADAVAALATLGHEVT